jgi:thiol-disulfide isomerase/thioredoxin
MRLVVFLVLLLSILQTAHAAAEIPEFKAVALDSEVVDFTKVVDDNELVLLTFWIASCVPCNRMLALTNELQQRHGKDGLQAVVVYVYCDLTAEAACCFWESCDYDLPVVVDCEGEIACSVEANAYPLTLVIHDGEVIARIKGFNKQKKAELTEAVESALDG